MIFAFTATTRPTSTRSPPRSGCPSSPRSWSAANPSEPQRRDDDGSRGRPCHRARCAEGRRQRPSDRGGRRRVREDRPDAGVDGSAVPRRGVELLDRLGLRQADHRRRPGSGAVRPGHRAPHGTTAFNASGDLAGLECKGGQDWSSPPGSRRCRAGFGRVAARDDRRRWHDPVHRRERRMAGRTGLVRRAALPGHRRRGVGAVRPARMAARGVQPDRPGSGRRKSVDPRRRRRRRPVHRGADRVQAAAGGRWRHLAVGADLGRTGSSDEPVSDRQRRACDRRSQSFAVSDRRRRNAAGLSRRDPRRKRRRRCAGPGYDLVTGLGTPDVDNLVRNILVLQKATA